jgi:hypothetical protein
VIVEQHSNPAQFTFRRGPNGVRRLARWPLIVVAWSIWSSAAEATVHLSPPRTRIEVPPGGHGRQTITVFNRDDEPLDCSVALFDWSIADGTAGGLTYHPAGSQPRSCTQWIQVWPMEFTLAPNSQQELALSASLPADADGSYFGAFILSPRSRSVPGESAMSVSVQLNHGHLVTLDAAGRCQAAAEVEGFAISRPDDTGSLELTARIANRGNTGLRPEGSLAIVDEGGHLVGKVPLKTYFAQPGGHIAMREQWDGLLLPGRYRVIGTINLGDGRFLTPEKAFEVVDRVELAALEVEGLAGAARCRLVVRNPGNITASLSGTARLHDGRGSLVRKQAMDEIIVLPGEEIVEHLPLDALAAGQYRLELDLRGGRHQLQAGEAFEIR